MMNPISAPLQPCAASDTSLPLPSGPFQQSSPTETKQRTAFRQEWSRHRRRSASSSPCNKRFDVFRDKDNNTDSNDGARDDIPTMPSSNQQNHLHVISTQGSAADGVSQRTLQLPTPKLPLSDRTNTSFDIDIKLSSVSPTTSTSREVPENRIITKFAVPLIPLQSYKSNKEGRGVDQGSLRQGDSADGKVSAKNARLEAETDRLLAEQKRFDLERLRAQLAAIPSRPKPKRLILHKLTSRAKKSITSNGSSEPSTPKSAPAKVGTFDLSPKSLLAENNWNEERVRVRCLSSTLNLPIAFDTTPNDIKSASASIIPCKVNPTTSVVVECLVAQGLERRLRSYENVRDVMNSWDYGHQNWLRIDATFEIDSEREIAGVPPTNLPLTDSSFLLYHSSRLREWNERWVTLSTNGQVFAANSADYNPDNGVLLCHLSEFDIYTPNEREMSYRLKAPVEFCYAIKRQHRAGLSPVGDEIVHYFCTKDKALANRFYELIHRWRSWYLIKRKIEFFSQQSALSAGEDGALGKSLSFFRSTIRREGQNSEQESHFDPHMVPSTQTQRLSTSPEESGHRISHAKQFIKKAQEYRENKPKALPKSITEETSYPPTFSAYEDSESLPNKLPDEISWESSSANLIGDPTLPMSLSQRLEAHCWRSSAESLAPPGYSEPEPSTRRPATADPSCQGTATELLQPGPDQGQCMSYGVEPEGDQSQGGAFEGAASNGLAPSPTSLQAGLVAHGAKSHLGRSPDMPPARIRFGYQTGEHNALSCVPTNPNQLAEQRVVKTVHNVPSRESLVSRV